jgi:hypothetical protein
MESLTLISPVALCRIDMGPLDAHNGPIRRRREKREHQMPVDKNRYFDPLYCPQCDRMMASPEFCETCDGPFDPFAPHSRLVNPAWDEEKDWV